MRTILFALVLVACTGDRPGNFTGQPACPKEISVKQNLLRPQPGWESFEDEEAMQLISVALYEGHPRAKASLIPDEEVEDGSRRVSTWNLAENGKRRYWIACYYHHTRIVLTRMIDSKVSICEVTCDLNLSIAGQPVILDIAFK